ncbi:MAG: hypothetical protein V3U20_08895 [Thermoplasmata archaeon]
MRYGGKERAIVIAFLILLCTINWSATALTNGIPDWELTIEIGFDKSAFNLSQSDEPVTFHGWVNYTGVSVIPLTVHLEPYSDLGDVFLSQYDFTFRLPDSIPFDGLNPIEPEWNSTITPALTISGYVQQGGLQTDIPSQSCIIPVYYYEEEEGMNETDEPKEQEFDFLLVAIPSYLLVSLIFISLVSWKTRKSSKGS